MITRAATKRLYFAFLAIDDAGRPVDKKVALASFTASTKMVHAFGVGQTEFHVEMTVHDTMRGVQRPNYQAINNTVQHAHDDDMIARLLGALTAIDTQTNPQDKAKVT